MKAREAKQMDWQDSKVSLDMRFHEVKGVPMYVERYDQVLSFHAPGLAPVRKGDAWFHIGPDGKKTYRYEYDRVFGYYYGMAAVSDHGKWFHIKPDGEQAYRFHFKWVGNFQENLCVVIDYEGHYYHINSNGERVYKENYRYAGDYHEGVAAVLGEDGLFFHVLNDGSKLNSSKFLEAGTFHKGYATVRDSVGWFHCNRNGEEVYKDRYASIEPFYNGLARVTAFNGEIKRIDETGGTVDRIRASLLDPFMRVSHDLVGYWKSFLLGKAIETGIFEILPANLDTISRSLSMSSEMVQLIMQALQERHYIEKKNDMWLIAEDYSDLFDHKKSGIRSISYHWLYQILPYWLSFLNEGSSAQNRVYESSRNFQALGNIVKLTSTFQDAMTAYAEHDYKDIMGEIRFCKHKVIIDAGGGRGFLSEIIASTCKESKIYLMETSQVNKMNKLFRSYPKNVKLVDFDLFKDWKIRANAVILAKILHDWNDIRASIILKNARKALLPGGKIYLIESGFDPVSGKNGLLSLHLYLVNGGKERSNEEMHSILRSNGFRVVVEKNIYSGLTLYECEVV